MSGKLSHGKPDPGMIAGTADNAAGSGKAFIKAIARHRHPKRETDPPMV